VNGEIGVLPVVQSCSLQIAIADLKAQRLYQMQWRAGGGTGAGNIACIGGNLRIDQGDTNHQAQTLV